MKDYYEILGVSKNASQKEIKEAFYKLAHKYHPDKGGEADKFKEINEAYQVLSNPEKRAQYDKYGQTFEQAGAGAGGSYGGFNWQDLGGMPFDFSNFGFDFDNQSQSDYSNFGDIFSEFFNQDKRKPEKEKRGKDLEVKLNITLEEAAFGAQKEITFKTYVKCEHCQGKGYEPGSKLKDCSRCGGEGVIREIHRTLLGSFTQIIDCPKCHGQGKIPEKPCKVCGGDGRYWGTRVIKVDVPIGVRQNETIKIKGEGEAGEKGASCGDLYLKIQILPHPVFERKQDDLYMTLKLSFPEAALGTEKEIATLDKKKIVVKIPAGIQSGELLRVKGKGIRHFNSFGQGDLFIKALVETPQKVSRRAKELLIELQKELGNN